MKQTLFIILIITTTIFQSCNNTPKQKEKVVDYSNKKVLDSLIKITPMSHDTLFLGFTIGMSRNDYQNQIQKLKDEGKTISYSKSNSVSTVAGTFDLGAGYTFKTNISAELSDKTVTGQGKYYLEPIYNKNGNLIKLNIVPFENWDGNYSSENPNWLESKIKKNSEPLADKKFKKALIDNDFFGTYDFVQKKGNLIIYETTLTINYIDLNALLMELYVKEAEKEIIKKENTDVKF